MDRGGGERARPLTSGDTTNNAIILCSLGHSLSVQAPHTSRLRKRYRFIQCHQLKRSESVSSLEGPFSSYNPKNRSDPVLLLSEIHATSNGGTRGGSPQPTTITTSTRDIVKNKYCVLARCDDDSPYDDDDGGGGGGGDGWTEPPGGGGLLGDGDGGGECFQVFDHLPQQEDILVVLLHVVVLQHFLPFVRFRLEGRLPRVVGLEWIQFPNLDEQT
jgi:hypothetical protein